MVGQLGVTDKGRVIFETLPAQVDGRAGKWGKMKESLSSYWKTMKVRKKSVRGSQGNKVFESNKSWKFLLMAI